MASLETPGASAYIVIKHGNRRRLLSKPPSFDALMSRACEIFEFAPNTQVCAYFQYRNHLDNYVEMELDPSAYHFLKTGDELEWKCFDKAAPNAKRDADWGTADGDHNGPRYLGFGNGLPADNNGRSTWGDVPPQWSVASEVPSSMRGYGWTPKYNKDSDWHSEEEDKGGDSTDEWGQAPDAAVRSSHGNESGDEGMGTPSRRNSWGEDVFTAPTDDSVSGSVSGGGGGDDDGANMWLRPMPRGPLPERASQTRWAPDSSPPRRRRQGRERE